MSVTFAPALFDADIRGWTLQCACGSATSTTVWTHPTEAADRLPSHTPLCGGDYCAAAPGAVVAAFDEEPPEVNMTNLNAAFVLDNLGINCADELCGIEDADVFLGRILVALAVAPADEGTPSYADSGAGEGAGGWAGMMVHCGRPSGYLQAQLNRLHTVAEWADARNRQVAWD